MILPSFAVGKFLLAGALLGISGTKVENTLKVKAIAQHQEIKKA